MKNREKKTYTQVRTEQIALYFFPTYNERIQIEPIITPEVNGSKLYDDFGYSISIEFINELVRKKCTPNNTFDESC